MSNERTPSYGSRLFPANHTVSRSPAQREESSDRKRGITAAYRSGEGLNGYEPSYHKHRDTLWQGWDRTMADPSNPARKAFDAKRREGQAADNRIHQAPVSQPQVDRLKAERQKARLQAQLIPPGPGGARARSARDAERERKIAFQEKQLFRQSGKARSSFDASSKAQTRGPLRGPDR